MCISDYLYNSTEHISALNRLKARIYKNSGRVLSDPLGSELQRNINSIENDIKRKRITGLYILAGIKDTTTYQVLMLRYCDGCSFQAISERLLYSEKNIYYHHKKGIQEFDKIEQEYK